VLLTGVAGCGKSGVVRGAIETLRQASVGVLAFRVDQHLSCRTSKELGLVLTERDESPAVTLAKLYPKFPSVLIIDQVDAISEVSGRNGAVRQTVLRLLDEAHNLKTVRVLLVCRSFDLDNDAQLKSLKQADQVQEIGVGLLDWTSEVGPFLKSRRFDMAAFTVGQRALLELPLNLALFVEGSEEDQAFSSRTDLFDRLMSKKERAIARARTPGWSAASALGSLVNWMSDRQRLDAPVTALSEFPLASDVLASEHLIVNVRGKVNLFHESFFDYLFARQFVHRAQSLEGLLTSTEQHLFRRTQTRQILEVLRSMDRPRYLRELKGVLSSKAIRYHIKNVVALWLATLRDPTLDELQIIQGLDTTSNTLPLLVRDAMLGSVGWFDLLRANGRVSAELSGAVDSRLESVLNWLERIAGERPTEVAALLDEWWGNDLARAQRLLSWFRFVSKSENDAPLLALCERVIRFAAGSRSEELLGKNSMLIPKWVAERGEDGVPILRALFDAWFENHPGRHPFEHDLVKHIDDHWLGEVAETSPKVFLDGAGRALAQSLKMIAERKVKGESDYTFSSAPCAGDRFGADAIFASYRSALQKLAASEPIEARRCLTVFDPAQHHLFRHLHLEAIAASSGALAGDLMRLLAVPKIEKAGYAGAEWKSLADAARVSIPHLTDGDRDKLEAFLLAIRPELVAASEMASNIKETGEDGWQSRQNVMWWLSRSGHARWCILKTIGPELLSEDGRNVLAVGDRKFRGEGLPQPNRFTGGWVHSPIARDRAALMSDAHWLRAIATYGSGRKPQRRNLLDGGPSQLAGELQHLTKTDPKRFVDFMTRIPIDTNPVYIDHILWGLAEADGVDLAVLELAAQRAYARSSDKHGGAIVRLFERHPKLGSSKAMRALLYWYAEHGEASAHDATVSGSDKEDITTINDLLERGMRLHVRGINGCRGAALEAIGQVLWEVPSTAAQAWALLDDRIETETLIGVRCCMARPLLALFNHDRERCAALFERLPGHRDTTSEDDGDADGDDSIAPWVTHEATRLMPFIVHQVPDVGRRLIDKLLASKNDTFRLIGAWHALGASFSIESYIALADHLMAGDAVVRRLAAATAAGAIEHQEFRGRAEDWLRRYFNDPDKQVRTQAAEVFRAVTPDEFYRLVPLATDFIASAAFYDASWCLLHALETATCDTHALVIKASTRLTEDLEQAGAAGGRRMTEMHTLQDLIRRDYAASDGIPALRNELLDIIDRLLAAGVYGVDTITKAHERS